MFRKFKVICCSYTTFNEALKYARKYLDIKLGKVQMLSEFNAYLSVEKTKVFLWYKKDRINYEFRFRLDGDESHNVNGMEAYVTLKKYWKDMPDLTTDPFYEYKEYKDGSYGWMDGISTCSGIIGFNEQKQGQRYKDCFGYDINSAFNYAMLNDMPDTSKHPREFDYVKENEIGFDYDEDGNFTCLFSGHYARYIFDLMPSPFRRFADVWYKRKKDAKTKEEKERAKSILTHSIGYLQRKNPFLRAAIIYYSNSYIKQFIDEDTLYWNTDSIVSLRRREDIEKNLGPELGQWKIEHSGSFAYIGNSYQWNDSLPTIRGVPKNWFKDFDILKDPIPSQGNIYYIDEKFYLRKVKI